eukprot:2590000-Amphidinium_carterae.1
MSISSSCRDESEHFDKEWATNHNRLTIHFTPMRENDLHLQVIIELWASQSEEAMPICETTNKSE